MDIYTTEEQQVDAIKRWWNANGLAVIVGVILGLAAVFGWRYWQHWQQVQSEHASELYSTFLREQVNANASAEKAQTLLKDYPKTAYAKLAALSLAKSAVQQGKWEEAAKQLRWVLDHADHDLWRYTATTRLARVLQADGKAEEALQLLEQKQPPKAYQSLYAEIKGDIYLDLGKTHEARLAYQQAQTKSESNVVSPLLALKEQAIPEAAVAAGTKP